MRHVLAVLVRNRPGVMARVASLFFRRGFNILSVAVGATEDPATSRMTLVADEDGTPLEQVTKQLHKLIDVLKVSDITMDAPVQRELVLLRVSAPSPSRRLEVLQLSEVFGARVVDVGEDAVSLEATGEPEEMQSFLRVMRPFGIKELVRSGVVAMARPDRAEKVASADREGVCI